jgi:NAD(P)-dependent dehydrogenase (short-subunit alcohol dehydrogenase family)
MIIGAGPAIGRGVAEKFGSEGWAVVLAAHNPERLAEEAAALSAKGIAVHTLAVDATDPVGLRAVIAQGDELTGGLTVVHFNAAVVRIQDLFSMTDAEVTGDLAINVAAGLHTIRAAVGLFGDRGGTILVTGGGIATVPNPNAVSLASARLPCATPSRHSSSRSLSAASASQPRQSARGSRPTHPSLRVSPISCGDWRPIRRRPGSWITGRYRGVQLLACVRA